MSHEKYKACIEACLTCAIECNHCAEACFKEFDLKTLTRCIRLDQDCADICSLAASLMARGSESAKAICSLCADICKACGDECSKHKTMEHCKRCAKACYRCLEECKKMASM